MDQRGDPIVHSNHLIRLVGGDAAMPLRSGTIERPPDFTVIVSNIICKCRLVLATCH